MAKEIFRGWIARDEDGKIFIHDRKPILVLGWWGNMWNSYSPLGKQRLHDSLFQKQKFQDKPRRVKVTIETE